MNSDVRYIDSEILAAKAQVAQREKCLIDILTEILKKSLKDENLVGKLKGLDVLKSLIIFGSVYRFIGPVVVTPVATWLGNMLTGANKKTAPVKEPQAAKIADNGKDFLFSTAMTGSYEAAKAKFLKNQ